MFFSRVNTSRLESGSRIKILLIFLVLCLASALRLLVLDDRPLHNDEGVNYFFIQSMFREGFYRYSHQNYHGPTYFYLTALFESLIGDNEYGHRMSAVVSSMGIVLCPFLLGSLVSFRSKLYAMLLLALSSSGLYYGRYAIHESFLVFASLSFSIYLFRWIETRERKELLWIGFYLGLLISTKETFIIHFFATGAAALLLYGPVKIFTQLTRHYAHFLVGLLLCLFVVTIFFSGFFRHPDGLRELLFGIQQWVGRGHSDTGHHKPYLYYFDTFRTTEPVVLLGIIPIVYIVIYLITSRVSGLLSRDKKSSLESSFACLANSREAFVRPLAGIELRFALFILVTGLLNFIVYSYVPYKTPWLIINLSAPSLFGLGVIWGALSERTVVNYFHVGLAWILDCIVVFLCVSEGIIEIINSFTGGWFYLLLLLCLLPVLFVIIFGMFCRVSSLVVMLTLILISAYYALKFNYSEKVLGVLSVIIEPQGVYGPKNPFAYVHAYDEMVELGKDIDMYMERSPESRILIGTKSYWPLPFYLRKHDGKLGYVSAVTKPAEHKEQYQILILDPGIKMNDPAWDFRYYNMSDNQNANVYFKRK